MSDFAALTHWQPFSSGLVKVELASEDSALAVRYDFAGAGGFVVARRLFPLQLPERFRLRLRLRGHGQPNRFELKLVDPTGENVWWHRRAAVVWSEGWEEWLIESRDIEFAWGPAGGGQPREVSAVEIALVAEAGGAGCLWLAKLDVEDLSARERCVVSASGTATGFTTDWLQGAWRSASVPAWLQLDFLEPRAFAGLRVEWEPGAGASHFSVDISADGSHWQSVLADLRAGGPVSHVYLGQQLARHVRLRLDQAINGQYFGIVALDVVSVERARSLVDFLHDVARSSPRGAYPKYLSRQQSYWTVFGAPLCPAQGLLNEEGMVEVVRAGFTLEPYVRVDGEWLTWADGTHEQHLVDDYVPVPSVRRQHAGVSLQVRASAQQVGNVWCARLEYVVGNERSKALSIALAIAVRPFQVVPPWQAYREFGGVHPIHGIGWLQGMLQVNQGHWVIPQGNATGNVRAWLQTPLLQSVTPAMQTRVQDPFGLAQGEVSWTLTLAPGDSRRFGVLVPFTELSAEEAALLAQQQATVQCVAVLEDVAAEWRQVLDSQGLAVPAMPRPFFDSWKTSTAHILLNRDGPAIQPGPRRYARSWIRDGATMCAALLRRGNNVAVRDFLAWYAAFLRDDGFVPCCVDREGVDWLVEHDSHGQWMHVVSEYYRFTGDALFVQTLMHSVIRAGQYLMALRASRLTPEYDTEAKKAARGLIPESVSHEGYLAQPVHSYWDSFWAIRGLADAAILCRELQNEAWAETFAREEKALRASLTESIATVIAERGIPHIPGSVEWADFDPTASACAVGQLGESGCFPAEALRYTFDGFMQHWRTRMADPATRTKYSAYDIRVINALVKLGRREDAWEIAQVYMDDRRPRAWNQWPEITWPDPQSPGHLGDLPHSWIGAEYVLAFRSLFVDEYHDALVIGQGLQADWLAGEGVSLARWPTAWGVIGYRAQAIDAATITLTLDGEVAPPAGLDIQLPLLCDIESVDIVEENLISFTPRTVRVTRSPAQLTLRLKKGETA